MRPRFAHDRIGILVITLASAISFSCSPPPTSGDGDVGTVGFELQVAPGVTISAVSWNITNAGFSQSGTVNVQNSNTLRFQVGGVPAATGYTITLNATTVGWVEDGRFQPYDSQLRKLAKALQVPVADAGTLLEDVDG